MNWSLATKKSGEKLNNLPELIKQYSILAKPQTENLIIVPSEIPAIDDEDWNTPGGSKDPVLIPPSNPRFLTITRSQTPPKSTTPPKSLIVLHR
ncbi:unnamed protein product [Parnassius mnemosyne]|uniref:Uncharacterized protein n=1 Tax=Parnassius mnemosyne TaxID=213953 RepID=A0AAV1KVT2_9NEOP